MSADSPIAVLVDSAGNEFESVSNNTEHYLGTAVIQDVHLSTKNTWTTHLDAGASFTGDEESTLGVAAVQVMVAVDQPCTVTVQQANVSGDWDIEDTWNVFPGAGTGRTIQCIGTYFRVVVENISAADCTYTRIGTTLCPTVESVPRAATEWGTLRLAQGTMDSAPSDTNYTEPQFRPALYADVEGNLATRSQVLTDEESFRDDFCYSGLATNLSGTCKFVAGTIVVGTSTSFRSEIKKGDYVKLSTDAGTAFTQVQDVYSDTVLLLTEDYLGTPGSGTGQVGKWVYGSATGSLAYSGSELTLTSSATSGPGVYAYVERAADYAPFELMIQAKINNRYANQEGYIGMLDTDLATMDKQVLVKFSGTTNTTVIFQTSFDSSDVETTTCTLPNAGVTSDYHDYVFGVGPRKAILWIDKVKVAEHTRHIPGPYDTLKLLNAIQNTGAVSGSTNLIINAVAFENYNRVEVALSPREEPINVLAYRPNTTTLANVTAAASDTLVLAANLNRIGATVQNDSTALLYLKLGASGASTTSYTVKLKSQDYYEVPYGFTGVIYGYWEAANGAARVTEIY